MSLGEILEAGQLLKQKVSTWVDYCLLPPLVLFLPAICVRESSHSVTHRMGCHFCSSHTQIDKNVLWCRQGQKAMHCVPCNYHAILSYVFCTQLWGIVSRSSMSPCSCLFPTAAHHSSDRWKGTGEPIAFVGYNSPKKPFVGAVKMGRGWGHREGWVALPGSVWSGKEWLHPSQEYWEIPLTPGHLPQEESQWTDCTWALTHLFRHAQNPRIVVRGMDQPEWEAQGPRC